MSRVESYALPRSLRHDELGEDLEVRIKILDVKVVLNLFVYYRSQTLRRRTSSPFQFPVKSVTLETFQPSTNTLLSTMFHSKVLPFDPDSREEKSHLTPTKNRTPYIRGLDKCVKPSKVQFLY